MPRNARLFINKVIENDDVQAFKRHGIRKKDLLDEVDKKVYDYIVEFSEDNDGHSPSYATVTSNFPSFIYTPGVTESYKWLTKQIKDRKGRQMVIDLFDKGNEFGRNFNDLSAHDFLSKWIPEATEKILSEIDLREEVGVDLKTGVEDYVKNYYQRKEGKTSKSWESNYSVIGSYESGNMYTLYGKSGRGKSIFALEEAINTAFQGGNVLYWGLEMPRYELMSRAYSSISSRIGAVKNRLPRHLQENFGDSEGKLISGFKSSELRSGELDEEVEEGFVKFLEHIGDIVEGNIVFRSVNDPNFSDRSVSALQADIITTGADFVVVDPFYYLDMESNKSRTTGGAEKETSHKLRKITGIEDVVVLALTQSDEKSGTEHDSLERELELPQRGSVTSTSALLQDAALQIGIDSKYQEGIGIIGVTKGRNGGEGEVSNVLFMPQYGKVEELKVGVDALVGFDKFTGGK